MLSFDLAKRQIQLAERQQKIVVLQKIPKYQKLADTMVPEDWDRVAGGLKSTGIDLNTIVKEAMDLTRPSS